MDEVYTKIKRDQSVCVRSCTVPLEICVSGVVPREPRMDISSRMWPGGFYALGNLRTVIGALADLHGDLGDDGRHGPFAAFGRNRRGAVPGLVPSETGRVNQ